MGTVSVLVLGLAIAVLVLLWCLWRWWPARRHRAPVPAPSDAAAFQEHILKLVSRSFALTIPLLPREVRCAVGNAYLLCRIADTIEDDAALSAADKRHYEQALIEVVEGRAPAAALAAEIGPRLSQETPEAERVLMLRLPDVIAVYDTLRPASRQAMARCIRIMGEGMHHFQQQAGPAGLATLKEMERYCYHVAGVVGEMLTELFCDYDPAIATRRGELQQLELRFGLGLQMTNILKDQWEDRERGICWLPRDVYARHGVTAAALAQGSDTPAWRAAQAEMIGLTHACLRDAQAYSLLIPAQQRGIRRFCLWAIGLALVTLRNLARKPDFRSAEQVKVSRPVLVATVLLINLATRSDRLLKLLFKLLGWGLPLSRGDWAGRSTNAPASSPGTP